MAYWTVTGTLSLIVSAVLIALLILLSGENFMLKQALIGKTLGGLYLDLGALDAARIETTIDLNKEMDLSFNLPINQTTVVELVQDNPIGARISLSTGGMNLTNVATKIVQPAGTRLPIQLEMSVPVNLLVPIDLEVPVNIPLADTDLHAPFTHLQRLLEPYLRALWKPPYNWDQLSLCSALPGLCDWWFHLPDNI